VAIEILSGNLNTYGNAGQFETDRSTWGFADNSWVQFTRSGFGVKASGNYSGKGLLFNLPGIYTFLPFHSGRVFTQQGKKYLASAKVRVTAGFEPGSDGNVLSIERANADSDKLTQTILVTKTIGDIKGAFVEIQSKFVAEVSGWRTLYIYMRNAGFDEDLNEDGFLYCDDFKIYEIQETVDDGDCTLEIDSEGTVIVDESAPGANNGSISVAITGGVPPFQYSKNNGVNWQSSPLFAGLAAGIYKVKVREADDVDCEDLYPFAVNSGAAAFDFTTEVTHETYLAANDGIIEVTVTGDGGPFTFSKDAGDNYQASNLFEGVSPGTYLIVVKDASDKIKAAYVTVNEGVGLYHKAYLSKDPIPFILQETGNAAEDNYRIHADVRVQDEPGGPFNSKLKTDLEPESDGYCRFNLRQAFVQDVLKAIPPAKDDASITVLNDRVKVFKVYYGDVFDNMNFPEDYQVSQLYLVMLGGLDKKHYPGLDFFGSYLPSKKKFLTWAPVEKTVNKYQEEYLNFFVVDITTLQIKVKIVASYDDETSSTFNLFTKAVQRGDLLQIPVGPAHSSILAHDPTKNLVRYKVSLLNQDDVLISEERTFTVLQTLLPNTRYFLFENSLGSFDTLRCSGKAVVTAIVEKDIIQRHLPMDYAALDGELQAGSATFRKESDHSSGHLTGRYGKAYQQYLLDFMVSKQVYEITSGNRVPVVIDKSSMRYQDDESNEYYLRFKAIESYTNHSVTPDEI
jgi:hypothetical protein